MTDAELSLAVMTHRYRYYVLAKPTISDQEYDALEREAVERLPAGHPVHQCGSDRAQDYEPEVVREATP